MHSELPDYKVLDWMEVSESFRQQGIGKRLLARIVQLHSNRTIIAALEHEYLHAMYIAQGFVRKGEYTQNNTDGSTKVDVWFYRYPSLLQQE